MRTGFGIIFLIGLITGCSSKIPASGEPECIRAMIAEFKKKDVANPPRKIIKYQYRQKTVYYVSAECCDQFSYVYDSECNVLGAPDGGYTGRGDGKLPDFSEEAVFTQTVWQDNRKRE